MEIIKKKKPNLDKNRATREKLLLLLFNYIYVELRFLISPSLSLSLSQFCDPGKCKFSDEMKWFHIADLVNTMRGELH